MTWFSEYSASPRRRLARSAIRCPSVDRFAGFSVPSRVSGQRLSLRGASLPSTGSRRARFPGFPGTMKTLRLPVRVTRSLMASVAGSTCSSVFVFAAALPGRRRTASGPGRLGQPVCPLSGGLHMGTHGISQVSWRSIPYLCPVPRPRPDRQDLALCGPVDAALGTTTPKAPAGT
jgi:hypothetical protein